MDHDTIPFEQFLAERIKERNISLKKLAETTGIAPSHIESLIRGDFEAMPSAPYFRGYLMQLGNELNFNGEEWWQHLKKEGVIKNSGEFDTLPRNRFIKQSPPKYLWAIGAGVLVLIFFAFQAPRIFGKPTITMTAPDQTPFITTSSTYILAGNVKNADSLYLNDNQEITISPDGSWQETVLLGAGPNPFKISAKKFLGGQTDITEEIIYEPGNIPVTETTSTTTITSTTTTSTASGSKQ